MKTVLITGGNRGIGLSFCKYYKSNGWNVIATSRKPSQALLELGIEQLELDVGSDSSIEGFKNKVKFPIDLLINNAGILHSDTIETTTRSSILEQFNVNSIGPLMVTKALMDNLSNSAKVVNITSSMGSIQENSSGGFYGYRASKAALNMVTKSMALEMKGIPVLALHPGYIQTDMTGGRGDMSPDESVSRMAKIIEEFSLERSGEFRHRDGRLIPY
jgi:NAD(P)-dependent dehydrogenase (short-subunit alcohol dehydrogenase family)